jgi:Zn-dependent peptidase ImmA (M78 family)
MGVHGATRWIRSSSLPLVQLTLRCKTDDMLWFSFFHEAGHILRHARELFLEGDVDGREENADCEAEADAFAAEQLIPRPQMEELRTLIPAEKYPSERSLREFAAKIGVAPGIVVGRLHHDELLPRTHLNKMKRTLRWDDLMESPR